MTRCYYCDNWVFYEGLSVEKYCKSLVLFVVCSRVLSNSVCASDYFFECTNSANGRITYFDRHQISVFSAPIPLETHVVPTYEQLLVDVLKLWEDATRNMVAFRIISERQSADIRIDWTHQRRSNNLSKNVGEATLLRTQSGFHGEIKALLRDRTTLSIVKPKQLKPILLHEIGHAHSIEAWFQNKLVGGLYGVHIGGCFFGESMFSKMSNASKVCLVHLIAILKIRGFSLLDTQVPSIQRLQSAHPE